MLCPSLDGREAWGRVDMCVWVNPFAVNLKLSQHCWISYTPTQSEKFKVWKKKITGQTLKKKNTLSNENGEARKYAKNVDVVSCVWLSETLWTAAHQAPLSMEFSRQEYWSALPFSTPGDLLDPGIEP